MSRSNKEKRLVPYNNVVSDPAPEYAGNMIDLETGDVYYEGKKIASNKRSK